MLKRKSDGKQIEIDVTFNEFGIQWKDSAINDFVGFPVELCDGAMSGDVECFSFWKDGNHNEPDAVLYYVERELNVSNLTVKEMENIIRWNERGNNTLNESEYDRSDLEDTINYYMEEFEVSLEELYKHA